MTPFPETWLIFGGIAVVAIIALLALLLLLSRLRATKQPSACLVIGDKRYPLREPVQLGREHWKRVTGKWVSDVVDHHAELFPTSDGAWELRLAKGEYMFVDGRRSRHNRLRSGAVIALGKTRQVAMQFVLQD